MARRERTVTINCGHKPCGDTIFYCYSSQREYAEIMQGQKRSPYFCARHKDPAANLRPGNEAARHVLVATRLKSLRQRMWPDADPWRPGLYWVPEGGRSGSGLIHGPGFTAYAADFPEGTRLVVTTRIEMPQEAE